MQDRRQDLSQYERGIIDRNVPHSYDAQRAGLFIHFADADSDFGCRLKELLGDADAIDLEPLLTPEQRTRYCSSADVCSRTSVVRALCSRIVLRRTARWCLSHPVSA